MAVLITDVKTKNVKYIKPCHQPPLHSCNCTKGNTEHTVIKEEKIRVPYKVVKVMSQSSISIVYTPKD